MPQIRVQCVFVSPLLMDPMTEETLNELLTGVRGAVDRSRSAKDIAASKLYREDGPKSKIGIPAECLFACLVAAGRNVKNGKKAISTAVTTTLPELLSIEELFFPLANGKADLNDSWTVDKRRGVLKTGGTAVCIVRPKFPAGVHFAFTIDFDDKKVKPNILRQLVDNAGSAQGLGSFRPNKRGPFGRFRIMTVEQDSVDGWEISGAAKTDEGSNGDEAASSTPRKRSKKKEEDPALV